MNEQRWKRIDAAREKGLVTDHEYYQARQSEAKANALAATCFHRLNRLSFPSQLERRYPMQVARMPPDVYSMDVIIPYHDEIPSHWLVQAIESVLCQNRANVIVHCVLDGGARNNPLPERYLKHRLVRCYQVIQPTERVGPYPITNKVSAYFRCKMFMVQDADDISLPNRARLSGKAITEGAAVAGGHMEQFLDEDSIDDDLASYRLTAKPVHHSGQIWFPPHPHFIHGASVIRLDPFLTLNGYCELVSGADTEFMARIQAAGYQGALIDEVVALRRLVKNSLSHSQEFGFPNPVNLDRTRKLSIRAAKTTCINKLREFGRLKQDRMRVKIERVA